MKAALQLIEALGRTTIYQQYEAAFSRTTGLPLTLRPLEFWQMPHRGKPGESRFCGILAENSRACAYCLRIQRTLADKARESSYTNICAAGLADTAVPVRLGERLVGFLQTGQIFQRKPDQSAFKRVKKMLLQWGAERNLEQLREAYYATRVVTPQKYESAVLLLRVFAEHLSILGNQMMLRQESAEPPLVKRAKEYILEHQSESVSLAQVAKAVSISQFYLCKLFKKSTGLNYVDYVSRLRVEKAKNLLLNPNLRVNEIASAVGFQSLAHFNRVFKKIVGQAPLAYRRKLPLVIALSLSDPARARTRADTRRVAP